MAREDWKLVIDSLQRVIDDSESGLIGRTSVASDGGILYESARRQAFRMIASLPPEGLSAYRVYYDGQAKRLFDRARAEHDSSALRLITRRFLMTQYGDDASELLASWALDEGRAGEVVALLTDVVELVPDYDVPDALLFGKLAAAYALLGRMDQANELLSRNLQPNEDSKRLFKWLVLLETAPTDQWREGAFHAVSSPYRPGPPVVPSLLESAPWHYALPGATSDLWRRIYDDDPAASLVLPTAQFVSDGNALFVRKPDGCTSLDLQDLTVVWDSTEQRPVRRVRGNPRSGIQRQITPAQPAAERMDDYIGGTISVAHGLVFIVERGSVGVETKIQDLAPVLQPNRTAAVNPVATRLVARDARNGEIRWQRGATDDSDDVLADVQFRAAALAVGENVWVPYFKQSDLYIAVLNPTEGTLVRSFLLGSAREFLNSLAPSLLLAFSDGLVFVPTGHGTLFAVDAADMTIRWAVQYERGNRPRRDPRTAPVSAWLPSPPVVAGGLVLLAATDHRELLAFSAAGGEFRWSSTVEHGSYVIAADSARVWLGGRNISCLNIVDGKPLWTTRLIAVPTGRGVLSGEMVHVPTSEGLLTLDAATGTASGVQATPPSQVPLGDLLCVGTALFSIDPSSVRRFTDLERSREVVQARLDAFPGDPSAAMQLAWIELLSGYALRADEILEQIPSQALAGDPRRMESFARVRVETALSLASKATSGSPEALRWLQIADAVAQSDSDRLRCQFAMADQHFAAGRYEAAYENLLRFGLRPEADQMVHAEDSVDTVARTQVASRLLELHGKLTAQQASRIEDEIGRQLTAVKQRLPVEQESSKAQAQLLALCELPTIGSTAKAALLELAVWDRRKEAYERAEQLLRAGARNRFDPTAITSLTRLCELYGQSAQNHIAALIPCLDELELRFGSEPIPKVAALPTEGAPPLQLVKDWTSHVRSAIPTSAREAYGSPLNPEAAEPRDRFEFSGRSEWTYNATEGSYLGRIVRIEPEDSPLLRDRIVLHRSDGALECLSTSRGEHLWQTALRFPEEFRDVLPPGSTAPVEPARRAIVDGQTAIFNDAEGLYAVGLITGRRLWIRSYETPGEVGQASKRDWAMAAADGLLAAAPIRGRLTLMRARDGSTIWERDLRGEPVDAIWMQGDRIVTTDAPRQRVHLFDRATGRLIKKILFQQSGSAQQIVRLIRTAGMIIGPDSSGPSRGVVAVDDAQGEIVWRVDLDKPAVQLFEPMEGYLGIGLGQGMVRVVDSASGETLIERQVTGAYSVTGGALFDGLLILRVEAVRGPRQTTQLVALDVATGEEVWRREDIMGLPNPDEPLSVKDGFIPALMETTQPEVTATGAQTARLRTLLVLIDARTGSNVGQGADLSGTSNGGRFVGDVVVREGAVIVGTQRSVNAYRAKPPERNY